MIFSQRVEIWLQISIKKIKSKSRFGNLDWLHRQSLIQGDLFYVFTSNNLTKLQTYIYIYSEYTIIHLGPCLSPFIFFFPFFLFLQHFSSYLALPRTCASDISAWLRNYRKVPHLEVADSEITEKSSIFKSPWLIWLIKKEGEEYGGLELQSYFSFFFFSLFSSFQLTFHGKCSTFVMFFNDIIYNSILDTQYLPKHLIYNLLYTNNQNNNY